MRSRPLTAASATQQQIKLLAASNACLRRNLVQFSHGLKQVGQLAYRDELTGLANRYLMLDRLRQAMRQSTRRHKQVLLVFVVLDGFKGVNDRLGFIAEDMLLKQVATRLTARIRAADTACRYGADEFVLMMPEIEGEDCAAVAVDKIREQLTPPYEVEDHVITLTASVGAALYGGGDETCEHLLRQAVLDMYRAKASTQSATVSPPL